MAGVGFTRPLSPEARSGVTISPVNTSAPERPRPEGRLTSLVGVPVVAPHSLRHLQSAVSVLAGEAGLGEAAVSRLQGECSRLVATLMERSPEGALVILGIVRRGGGTALEVTADYGPTAQEPLGGRLTASAWDPAG